ncbi:MAG: hypothetical protein WC647_07010 [Desulfomonilaceae bacterium]
MENRLYKVDSRMTPPIILAMLFATALIILSVVKTYSFLFLIVLTPFMYLGLEILARRVVLDSSGITINKFLRSKKLDWKDIQNVDAVRSGGKTFLIIQTESSRPVLITNTISGFPDLVNSIIERIPAGKVSEAAREISGSTQKKLWPIVQAWLVCLIFLVVMVGKFLE